MFRAIKKATRVKFGRKAVETGASAARVKLNHSIDDLFVGKHMKFKHKPKQKKKDDSSEEDDSGEDCFTMHASAS